MKSADGIVGLHI